MLCAWHSVWLRVSAHLGDAALASPPGAVLGAGIKKSIKPQSALSSQEETMLTDVLGARLEA